MNHNISQILVTTFINLYKIYPKKVSEYVNNNNYNMTELIYIDLSHIHRIINDEFSICIWKQLIKCPIVNAIDIHQEYVLIMYLMAKSLWNNSLPWFKLKYFPSNNIKNPEYDMAICVTKYMLLPFYNIISNMPDVPLFVRFKHNIYNKQFSYRITGKSFFEYFSCHDKQQHQSVTFMSSLIPDTYNIGTCISSADVPIFINKLHAYNTDNKPTTVLAKKHFIYTIILNVNIYNIAYSSMNLLNKVNKLQFVNTFINNYNNGYVY